MTSTLFIRYGSTCCSPMAEFVMKDLFETICRDVLAGCQSLLSQLQNTVC